MTAILALALLFAPTEPLRDARHVELSRVSHYAPGRMQEVIANRQNGCCGRYSLPDPLPQADGYIATAWPDDIGTFVTLRPVGSKRWWRLYVVDCGGRSDGGQAWLLRNGIVGEVDYETALAWGTVGRLGEVEVLR
jgi:hypothetical protein